MFESLTNEEKEQFFRIIHDLHFYGRKQGTKPYHNLIALVKETIGETACFNVLDALRNDGYIKGLPDGPIALTLKGIQYAEQIFKEEKGDK